MEDARLTSTRAELVAAARRRKLWADVGAISHRVLAEDLTIAVCSERLPATATRRLKGPVLPMKACGRCESLVAKARSAGKRSASTKPEPRRAPGQKGSTKKRVSRRKRPTPQTAKEVLLHGRRMVMPRVRIVSGGAPGLGKRR